MGRNLKRVPLDLDAPINKTWPGYLNPHYRKCPDCDHGITTSGEALEHLVHLLLIAGEDSRSGKLHPWLLAAGVYSAGTTLHELTTGLAGRSPSFFGHDACDRWSATKKIIEAAGLPENWSTCKTCDGHAMDPAVKEAYDAWTEEEPPEGPGYQLWENTSEGSPQSPVFETLDELCAWCADHATTFASFRATAEEWKSMLDGGVVRHEEGKMIFL